MGLMMIKTCRILMFTLLIFALACGKTDSPEPAAEKTEPTETQSQSSGYVLVSEETDVSFVIVSNSAGPITGRFPNGFSGSLESSGKGAFSVQLDTLTSLDQNQLENPLRDSNVVEAFFGVRPSQIFPDKVNQAWELLTGKLSHSVATARYEVSSSEGVTGLTDGNSGEGSLTGNLILWDKISVPLSFPVNISRSGDTIQLTSTAPVSFDLEQILGSDLRKLVFDTMLAAGCAHQPGIQNKVEITLHKVILKSE